MMACYLKRILFVIGMGTLVMGCTQERFYQGTGFQAASIEQNQAIDIVIKDRHAAQLQVSMLVEQFEHNAQINHYQVNYRSQLGKKVAEYALRSVAASNVSYHQNSDLVADVQLVVNSQTIITSECQAKQVGIRNTQPRCVVEAARFQQIDNKQRAMGDE